MRYLGMWEERVEQVIAELGRFAGYLCAAKHYLRILRRIEHYLTKLLLDNAFLTLNRLQVKNALWLS